MKIKIKPLLNIASFTIGVFGLVLSVYFYNKQKEIKSMSFVQSPSPTLVFSSDSISSTRISVVDHNMDSIDGMIFATNIFLWNNGTETIREEDIVVPLEIRSDPSIRVLDIRVDTQTRPDVNLFTTNPDLENRKIEINFRVLEESEGVRIYLLYQGTVESKFTFHGAVAGIKSIGGVDSIANHNRLPAAISKLLKLGGGILIAILGIWLFIAVMGAVEFIIKKFFPDHSEKILDIFNNAFILIFFVAIVLLIVLIVYSIFSGSRADIERNIIDYIPINLK